jgi:hypothetical protein
MNQRIRELLNQATTDALYETRDAVDFLDNPVSKQQRELQLEKFAQLIVRECADIAIDNGCGDFVDINQKLFEHFGVEL